MSQWKAENRQATHPVVAGAARSPAFNDQSQPLADADQFLVHELVDAEPAEFAAEAGPFHTAERQLDTFGADRVDEYHARLDPVGDPLGLFLIGGENVGPQLERGVVGQFDGLFF